MVILGKAGTEFGMAGLTWRDGLGLSLALLSTLSLAGYMILVQASREGAAVSATAAAAATHATLNSKRTQMESCAPAAALLQSS